MAENDDGIGDGNRRLRLLPNRCGSFTGSTLCKMLGNGIYRFPFPVYRETAKYGNNISMANNGFEHPCVLSVRNGVGMLQLKTALEEAGFRDVEVHKNQRGWLCLTARK